MRGLHIPSQQYPLRWAQWVLPELLGAKGVAKSRTQKCHQMVPPQPGKGQPQDTPTRTHHPMSMPCCSGSTGEGGRNPCSQLQQLVCPSRGRTGSQEPVSLTVMASGSQGRQRLLWFSDVAGAARLLRWCGKVGMSSGSQAAGRGCQRWVGA